MSREPDAHVGSGNVFADLDLPDPDELLAKARLVHRISEIVDERGWSPAQTAAALDVDQPTVSALLRGRLDGFAIEQIFRFLNALGQEIEIVIHDGRTDRFAGVVVTTA